jgi:ribosomal protein S2
MVAKNAKKKLTNLPLDEVGKVEKSIDDTFQTEKFKGLGFKKVLSVAKLQSVGAFEIKSKKHFNPAMVDYIKRGEGYFDPRKTEFELSQAYKEIYECVKNGGQVLFCSTDREPISNHLKEYGKKLKTFYVCQR